MSVGTVIIRILIWIGMKILFLLYTPFYIYRLFLRKKQCPPAKDPILLQSATVLVEKICRKEVSCETVIKTYIGRIREVNPLINAVVEERFDKALEEAKYTDKLISSSGLNEKELKEKYPLLGIPLTVKESIAVAGLSNNTGRLDIDRGKAEKDADIVKLARDAGAIPLLVSNTPELCMNWETFNKVTGTTRHPFDLRLSPGGSSGGEASLLCSAASVIGLGSDVAGSLRLPAHFCGIWGHKPSPGAVSLKGHYPDCEDQKSWQKIFTLGPMSRYAVDLPLLLNCIMEPGMIAALRLKEPVQLNTIKVYYLEDNRSLITHSVSREIIDGMRYVIKHLQSIYKIKCEKINIERLKYSSDLSYAVLLDVDGIDSWHPKGKGLYCELLRFFTGFSKASLSPLAFDLFKNVLSFTPKTRIEKCHRKIEDLRQTLMNLLGDNAVLFCPTFTKEALYHGDVFRHILDYGYLALFSALGFPVTNCPIGQTANGLPIGMQVVASPNCDRLSLAVAMEIEKTFGGWFQPSTKQIADIA